MLHAASYMLSSMIPTPAKRGATRVLREEERRHGQALNQFLRVLHSLVNDNQRKRLSEARGIRADLSAVAFDSATDTG